jgi:hypothetical protein
VLLSRALGKSIFNRRPHSQIESAAPVRLDLDFADQPTLLAGKKIDAAHPKKRDSGVPFLRA